MTRVPKCDKLHAGTSVVVAVGGGRGVAKTHCTFVGQTFISEQHFHTGKRHLHLFGQLKVNYFTLKQTFRDLFRTSISCLYVGCQGYRPHWSNSGGSFRRVFFFSGSTSKLSLCFFLLPFACVLLSEMSYEAAPSAVHCEEDQKRQAELEKVKAGLERSSDKPAVHHVQVRLNQLLTPVLQESIFVLLIITYRQSSSG